MLVIEFSSLSWCQSCITQLSDFFVFIGILLNDNILRILTSCHTSMQPNDWISKSCLLSFLRRLLWGFLYLCLCTILLSCRHYEMLRLVPRIIFTIVLYRLNAMYPLDFYVSCLVKLIVPKYWKLRSILWLPHLLLISQTTMARRSIERHLEILNFCLLNAKAFFIFHLCKIFRGWWVILIAFLVVILSLFAIYATFYL